MNILYISRLNGAQWSGPSYSVPAQIKAQSEIDNVYWLNLGTEGNEEWEQFPFYHNEKEIKFKSISNLCPPFDCPDIVVIEQFYGFAKDSFFKELRTRRIPYVIVPRGEFTNAAQKQKKLKKQLANVIYLNNYIKNAVAIQYLTNREKEESGRYKNVAAIVIPNGTYGKKENKEKYNNDGVKFTYIGRIDVYHKGLDLLIEACTAIKGYLDVNKVRISIYGPDRDGNLNKLKDRVNDNGLNHIIYFYDAVVGEAKKKILLETDIFLMTSRFEGLPMALIEAMSYGVPCAVTTGTNMKDEIIKNDAGWGCDGTVDGIKNMLMMAVSHSKDIDKKGINARDMSMQYTWNNIAKLSHYEYESMLKMVLNNKG
ncbi:MAG: glycosyltransferase [Bacteroides sp.]|nr:glycosyltransferase [Bacteroides sp.]